MNEKVIYIWGLASRFVPQFIYLITTIILARYVSPDDFGKIGVLAVIFTVANILIDSGLGGSLIKETEISRVDCSTISVFNILVGCLIYLLLFCTSSLIESFFKIEGLASIIRIIGVIFPISALGVVPVSLLKRDLKFNYIFRSSLIGVIVASFVSILLAIKGFGVYALVAYQIVVNLVMSFLNCKYSGYPISFYCSYYSLKKLIPFGFYTSIVTIVDTIYENLMTILTGKCLGVQTAGFIYQAKRLEETMSSSFAVAVGIVAFPILTKLKYDKELFMSECLRTLNVITLLVFPILFTVSLLSPYVIEILFGSQWLKSADYLRVLMFAGAFIIMEQLMLSFIKAWGKVKSLMYWTFVKRGIAIILLLLTILLDAEILVYTYFLTAMFGFVVNFFLIICVEKKYFMPFLKTILVNLSCSILYYVTGTYFVNEFSSPYLLIVGISCFICFYYFIYLKYKGINILRIIKSPNK